MAAFDGTIRIDTKVDSKGFNNGVKGLSSSLKTLVLSATVAAAALAAIATAGALAFGKSAVQAASDIRSAYIGLQSVVEGMGRSYTRAKEFLQSYVADGLIPAADAVTAYKNLLMRGYSTEQIEKVMNALKDSSAFGRQGSLTMGQAVRSATEGLKNENSILVDNAGVTKNVSMMWKDYAASIGTSVAAMSKQQKIAAEVAGIMEETRFQTGDAAKAAGTYAGQVSALNVSFLNLKVAVGSALIPVLQKIIPLIKGAIDAMTAYFNKVATIVSIFFGVDLNKVATDTARISGNTEDAADAQADLATQTDKAKKAAKGALAAFDQLNVLQQPEDKAQADTAAIETPALDTEKTDASLTALEEKVKGFKENLAALFAPAALAFENLKAKLAPLGEAIASGLGWAWENILVPFGQWAISSFLPAFLDMMAEGIRALNAALVVLNPVFSWLWDNILKPFASFVGWLILQSIEGWTKAFTALANWLEAHPDLFANFGHSGIIAWEAVKAVWAKAGEWFKANVVDPIQKAFSAAWQFLLNGWKTNFETILSWWATTTANIGDVLRNEFNLIIGLVNGMLRSLTAAVNSIANMLNSIDITIPEWVPVYGGQKWSLSIPTVSAPQIPRLASGAVIPANSEFAAILGDQTSGRNLEAPEGLIRQIIREEITKIQADIKIEFGGSLGQLVRQLKPYIDQEYVRVGNSLVSSGATS